MFHHHGPTFEEREQQQRRTEEEAIEAALIERRAFLQAILLLPLLSERQLEILADTIHMLATPLETLAYFVISPKGGTMKPTQQQLAIVTAGTQLQLVATGYDKVGNVDAVPTGNSLAWGTSDPKIATIDSTGLLTIADDAPVGDVSVTVQLAQALPSGHTPSGSAVQPIGAGEIDSFIITIAPAAQ